MKLKVCNLCKKEILDKDNYVRITDYKEGKFFLEGFYHTLCYANQIKGLNPQQQQAQGMLNQAKQLLERVQGKPKEVYQV